MYAAGVYPLGKTQGGGWRDGAGVNDDHAFAQRLLGAVFGEEHALDGGGVGNTDPDYVGILRRIGRRDGGGRAVNMLPGSAVPHQNFMSCFNQVGGHRPSHNAQTEKGNSHRCSLWCAGRQRAAKWR